MSIVSVTYEVNGIPVDERVQHAIEGFVREVVESYVTVGDATGVLFYWRLDGVWRHYATERADVIGPFAYSVKELSWSHS